MVKTSKIIQNRNDKLKRLKELRKEMEQIYWSLTETSGSPSSKEYLCIVLLQNDEILSRLPENPLVKRNPLTDGVFNIGKLW